MLSFQDTAIKRDRFPALEEYKSYKQDLYMHYEIQQKLGDGGRVDLYLRENLNAKNKIKI